MLIRHPMDSDGDGLPSVRLTDRIVDNSNPSSTCHSGVDFSSTGVLCTIQANGGFSAVMNEWLNSGSASGFYLQRTILSGTLGVDAGAGWLQLSTSRTYDNQKVSAGIKTTEVFFELSSDVSGTPLVATATMTFISEQGTL